MNDKQEKATVKLKLTDKRWLTLVGLLVIAIVAVLFIGQAMAPKRSVAEYCKVYKGEKSRLTKIPGDTWPSGVFDDTLGDANELAISFGRMEKVAPSEISSDLATLEAVYKKIHDDPSQAIAASLSGESAEPTIEKWTTDHCPK